MSERMSEEALLSVLRDLRNACAPMTHERCLLVAGELERARAEAEETRRSLNTLHERCARFERMLAERLNDYDALLLAKNASEAQQAERIRALEEALRGFLAIVDESRGVDGYHRNGEVARWGEFPEVEQAAELLEAKP